MTLAWEDREGAEPKGAVAGFDELYEAHRQRAYRLALLFITLVPLPFAFIGRPILVIVTYTIIGSLFIPFLAATLLYLNNRVAWTEPVPKNSVITNLLLIAILVLFAFVGAQEVIGALR